MRTVQNIAAVLGAALLTAAPAHAKCGTAQLDGTWFLQSVNDSGKAVTISGGNVMNGMVKEATISQTIGCKVTYTVIAPAGTLKGWSDFVRSSSSRKPKMIHVGNATAGLFALVRQ